MHVKIYRVSCETNITPITRNEVALLAPWQINSLAICLQGCAFNTILIDFDTIKDFVLSGSQVLFVAGVMLLFPSISLLQTLLIKVRVDFFLLCFACSLLAIS